MLEIKKITKIYETYGFVQNALNDVSIKFRENEFVSILGPSGSGKTTLLNIIGGLDKYTSGDLIINGTSTKEYKDSDWDTYRNHSIGFVFQSYNLIPHQSTLSNVELALTLTGVSKEERRKRALDVLKKVGLEDHINKKPTQMSGGQMQRIAIARALINDPDILLADEPTGALDSETSIQILELLKEVAKDRLVVLVTHNEELAEQYSTRIIRVLDGKIVNDSNPFDAENKKKAKTKRSRKSMSFKTALSLSMNNLLTKKGRTILTAFAGSIGIIGIALILSLSNGVQEYIHDVEENTLASYPITIERKAMNMSSMLSSLSETTRNKEEHGLDKIYSHNIMADMINMVTTQLKTNNLEIFKEYLDNKKGELKSYVNDIKYTYELDLQLYKADTSNGVVQVNPSTVMESLNVESFGMESGQMSGITSIGSISAWSELLSEDLLKSQYEIVAGKWPKEYNEVILMVDNSNEISDFMLYALGLKDQSELRTVVKDLLAGEEFKTENASFTYDEILNLTYKMLLNTDYYQKQNGIWINKKDNEAYLKEKIKNAIDIKVVGIVRNKDDDMHSNGGIGYTSALTEYVINQINNTEIVKEQKSKPTVNIFTGLEFSEGSKSFDMSSLSPAEKAYIASLTQEQLAALISNYAQNANATYEGNLITLGGLDLSNPYTISIYPKDFESKEKVVDFIKKYNDSKTNAGEEENTIKYVDFVGMLMKSVTKVIDMISYVLIAFVSISLVVSSIMIGIITYISVLERTKEIGILRAIGASKKDISRVFNAETFIVGLTAGVIGIGLTILINIPANIIIKHFTEVSNLSKLPTTGAVVLIIISMALTMFAGLIPSRMASKKDPVEALRTE